MTMTAAAAEIIPMSKVIFQEAYFVTTVFNITENYRSYSNVRQKFFPDSSSKKWGVVL
jgi:hypothetical protein